MMRTVISLVSVLFLLVTTSLAQESRPADTRRPARSLAVEEASRAPSLRQPLANVAETPAPSKEMPKTIMIEIIAASVTFDETGQLTVPHRDGDEAPEPDVLVAGELASAFAKQLNSTSDNGSSSTVQLNRVLRALAGTGHLESLLRRQLRVTEGEKAMLQRGERVPRVTGAAMSSRGRVNQTTMEDVGTLVVVQPQITSDGGLGISVQFERSNLGGLADGAILTPAAEGQPEVRTPSIETSTLQTVVAVRDGQTVVVSDDVRTSDSKVIESFVLMTAHIHGPG